MTVSATWPKAVCRKLIHARRAQKARRVRFQAGSSTPLHLIGVELEKVGDDFGFVRVVRKAVGGKYGAEVGELSPCFRAVNCTSV